jgi:4-hydroxythreonine-4-phosphate dehydrogenase
LWLNPHAGEEGILGNEEINIIKPAIQSLRKLGIQYRWTCSCGYSFYC